MNDMALVGGTVIDVVDGNHNEDGVVLVEDGRISSVAPRGATEIPSTARVVDTKGCWILPGLVDMHTHVSTRTGTPMELFLANGVTTIRDPGGRVTEQRMLRAAIDNGDLIGPRMFISGDILDGVPPVWPGLGLLVDTPDKADAGVRHLAAQGVDCIKIYNHVPEESLRVAVEAAGELELPIIGHIPRALSMRQAIEMGMECLEHIRITGKDFLPAAKAAEIDPLPIGQREPRIWEHIDLDAPWLADLIGMLAENSVYLDPTMIVEEVIFGDSTENQRAHADNRYLSAEFLHSLENQPEAPIKSVPDDVRPIARDALAKRREFVGRCAEAGVVILSGTDGVGLGRLLPGFGLHHELAILRDCGLSGLDTLRAATINSAQALGRSNSLGTVEEGRIADLVVTTADPLTAHLRPDHIEMVFSGGVRHDPGDLLRQARTRPTNLPNSF